VSNDNEVIGRSITEPAQFGVLYERHADAVHRFAARQIGAAADDVMSETFLVAFEKRANFDRRHVSARPWLLGIATTLVKQYARREAVAWRGMAIALIAEIRGAPEDSIATASDRLDAERAVQKLERAMSRLAAGDKDVLALYAAGDLDYRGIARALDVPVGTVRSRLNRARRVLRIALTASADQENDHGRTAAAAPRTV